MNRVKFFLGTHHPDWLDRTDVPLFVSRRSLAARKTFPRALGPWALDSGGFTELSEYGRWTVEPEQYADEVRLFASEVGNLEWAAIQDWMCEPSVRAKTGRTVAQHQGLTIESYLKLRELAPEIAWAPVLQGQVTRDYRDHVAQYKRAGVDLRALPVVGVGSVCRRQNTTGAHSTLLALTLFDGLENLHGFGFKTKGLESVVRARAQGLHLLSSADSLAWSLNARRHYLPADRLTDCTHASCSNCITFALRWRELLLERLERIHASN